VGPTAQAATHPAKVVGTLASMPLDDDDPEAPAFGGPPLPPEDRLWRHPSEMTPGGPDRSGTRGWIPVAAALGGATLTIAVLAATGSFRDRFDENPTVIERVAAPAVATVPVISVDAPPPPTGDAGQLVTVESAGESTGTGIVLRSDGHVLTAASLVGEDEQVLVVTSDGERGGAAVVGSDPVTGVAVLAVGWLAGRPGAVFGSPRSLAIGDPVTAATAGGDLAAAGQISDLSATGMIGGRPSHGLVRTTSALPADGVGGPVLDAEGHVVGLALWADPSPATWAVPIDLARQVADDIIDEGRAQHSWLGVEGEDGDTGPMLRTVTTDSPADRAGLTVGDVLVKIDDHPVAAMADVILALRAHRPGDAVTIEYRRAGQTLYCTAHLTER
jgi:putative serine protease PepD